MPTRRSGKGREAHLDVREGSGGAPGCLREVGRPIWRSERDREDHQDVREGSGDPPGGPGWVGRHTQTSGRPIRRSGRGWAAHPKV